jgi:putative sterol carrier protein
MDCKEFFANVEKRFKPEAAAGVDAVYQFTISGDGGGQWNTSISAGKCTVREGTADSPDCTVETDTDTWIDIVGQKTSAINAFMSGKLKVKGDMGLAMKLEPMFLK